MKREYSAPSLFRIGRITALTGMYRNHDYLDNSNGSDAWQDHSHEFIPEG